MNASLLCALLVLASTSALVEAHGPLATAAQDINDPQEAENLQQVDNGFVFSAHGSTRELLKASERTRKAKIARTRKPKKSRKAKDPHKRGSRKKASVRNRKPRGKPSVQSGGGGKSAGKAAKAPSKDMGALEQEALCATNVVEKEIVKSKNNSVHVFAIEEAFALACAEGSDVSMELFQDVFMSADAFVFAKTISKAIVTCKSDDEDAYECASVTASTDAYARATAAAHSEAVATAINSCGCMTEAVSESISSEAIYISLVAEASSTVTSSTCIKGKGRVRASAYDRCSSKVYGKVFAKAVSEAIVKGNCMNAEAITRVLTEVGGTFSTESTCGMTASAILIQ